MALEIIHASSGAAATISVDVLVQGKNSEYIMMCAQELWRKESLFTYGIKMKASHKGIRGREQTLESCFLFP